MTAVIDLFSGCGGLSLGASRTGLMPSWAIELDKHAATAHKTNFPSCNTLNGDISDVEPSELSKEFSVRPDIVFGGPPCQGFSYIGKRQTDDPRNQLLDRFFEFVQALKPRAFVMENVPGLLDPSSIAALEKGIGRICDKYAVLEPVVLDAARFGAATRRKRVVVIGFDPAEVDTISIRDILRNRETEVTISSAFDGLVSPGETDFSTILKSDNEYVRKINRITQGIGDEQAIKNFRQGYVSGFVKTTHTQKVIDRFSNTPQGQTEKISRFFRLRADEPARTLRAGTGSDRGSFQSARPIHHTEPRVISVREAARIQGFPDWFSFHPTKWHSHRMIGNSVNPIFAEAIFRPIAAAMGRT